MMVIRFEPMTSYELPKLLISMAQILVAQGSLQNDLIQLMAINCLVYILIYNIFSNILNIPFTNEASINNSPPKEKEFYISFSISKFFIV